MHYPKVGFLIGINMIDTQPIMAIATLTKKVDFGGANFQIGKNKIDLEKYNISTDLLLFRYD